MKFRMPFAVSVALVLLMVASSPRAQQTVPPWGSTPNDAAQSQAPPAESLEGSLPAKASKAPKTPLATHRFWDLENDLLFAGVAGGRGLDYSSTLNLRRRG